MYVNAGTRSESSGEAKQCVGKNPTHVSSDLGNNEGNTVKNKRCRWTYKGAVEATKKERVETA